VTFAQVVMVRMRGMQPRRDPAQQALAVRRWLGIVRQTPAPSEGHSLPPLPGLRIL